MKTNTHTDPKKKKSLTQRLNAKGHAGLSVPIRNIATSINSSCYKKNLLHFWGNFKSQNNVLIHHSIITSITPLPMQLASLQITRSLCNKKNVYNTCLEWGCSLCNQTTSITKWLVAGTRRGRQSRCRNV